MGSVKLIVGVTVSLNDVRQMFCCLHDCTFKLSVSFWEINDFCAPSSKRMLAL